MHAAHPPVSSSFEHTTLARREDSLAESTSKNIRKQLDVRVQNLRQLRKDGAPEFDRFMQNVERIKQRRREETHKLSRNGRDVMGENKHVEKYAKEEVMQRRREVSERMRTHPRDRACVEAGCLFAFVSGWAG